MTIWYSGAISYRCSIITEWICVSSGPAVSEIMNPRHIGVVTFTFQGHVMSSVTCTICEVCTVCMCSVHCVLCTVWQRVCCWSAKWCEYSDTELNTGAQCCWTDCTAWSWQYTHQHSTTGQQSTVWTPRAIRSPAICKVYCRRFTKHCLFFYCGKLWQIAL